MSVDEELHAFEMDRREHVENVIQPALEAGKASEHGHGTTGISEAAMNSLLPEHYHGKPDTRPEPREAFLCMVKVARSVWAKQ